MPQDETNGSVRITTRQVYDAVIELQRLVDGVRQALAVSTAQAEGAAQRSADHELRIRSLEQKIWALPGFAVLIGIASLVVTALAVIL